MGEETNKKAERIGFVPAAKIDSTVGKALWASHKKNADALNAARAAVSETKEQVRQAIAKKLNLPVDNLDFWVDGEGRIVVIRRFKERKTRAGTMPDLTAVG